MVETAQRETIDADDVAGSGLFLKVAFPELRDATVEANLPRATDSLKETQRQPAQDAAMYLPQGDRDHRMIAFLWGEASRTEEHARLIQGLEKLERVDGVIVVSRPSKMQQAEVPVNTSRGGGAS